MTKPYKNAAEVLPLELLVEVQKHHSGLLWIPKREYYHKERIRLVRELVRRKEPTAEIARLAGLTKKRVQQIEREMASTKREKG